MKTAVISGGNGGLGRAFATQLQAEGWRCCLLDLDISGLESTEQQVPISCDVTDRTQLQNAVAQILDNSSSIDLVIYNAGITHIGPAEGLDEATLRKVFDVNFFAATTMAQAFLEPLRRSKGTHLAMSSVAGFSPLFHRTAYAASKHALEGFFSSLRSEEARFGVHTMIAAPSFVATNTDNAGWQQDGTGRPGGAADGMDPMSAEDAVAVILKGVRKQVDFVPVGRVARLAYILNRLSPRMFRRVMERSIKGG